MPQKHILSNSKWAQRTFILSLLLCFSVSPAWSQLTQLYVTGTAIDSYKVYDGNYLSHVNTLGTLIGVADSDQVVLAAYAHYTDPSVGTGKTVFINYTISGPDAHKYLTPADDTMHADIIGRRLSVEGVQAASKTFDNTTTISLDSLGTLTGMLPADRGHVFHSMYASLISPDAGNRVPVVVHYVLYGSAVANYLAPTNDTIYAQVQPRTLTVSGVEVATSKVYDGTTYCQVTNNGTLDTTDIFPGDNVIYTISATYRSANVNLLPTTPIILSFMSSNSNYAITDLTDTLFAKITPRPLTVTLPEVNPVKEYDGTNTAEIITPAVPTNLIGTDEVELITTAYFDDANAGTSKQVFAHYAIATFGSNYTTPADELVSTQGHIIMPTVLDTLNLATGEAITAMEQGFCQGSHVVLKYHVAQGEPSMYRLAFDANAQAQGFINTGWRLRSANDSIITIDIPLNCQQGKYDVEIFFINEAEVSTEGYTAHFTINLPKEYLVQVFDDVLSVDNTCLPGEVSRFSTYEWYHNGEKISETRPYHQELGGLTGEYFVRVDAGMASEALICPWNESMRVSTVLPKTVFVYPSPVVSNTQVKLQGFDENDHTLRVFNSYGVQVYEATFSGRVFNLDMNAMPQGTYMISVDGTTAKTIKL